MNAVAADYIHECPVELRRAALSNRYAFPAEIQVTPISMTWASSALAPELSPVEETIADAIADRNAQIWSVLGQAIADGKAEGAIVSNSAHENFATLLDLLPGAFPAAEPYISFEGSICLDWYQDPQNQFSLLLQDDNRIAYAAYFAGERVNGSADFAPDALPRELLEVALRWAWGQRRR